MKKTLHFEVLIDAPRRAVWKTMLEPATYEEWTAEFATGSRFEGSWDEGARDWLPAFENYRFSDAGSFTTLEIDMDVTPDFEKYMVDAWPRALARLKAVCESPQSGRR